MCAINGVYKFQINSSFSNIIKKMCESMSYRGPDDTDVFENERVCFGQNRLSIIGVSNGHQPIFNEDKTKFIICNGEIYNYKELREDLIKKNHVFYTESDTEVILHLYEDMGIGCLNTLRGMFAFAIYDCIKSELFIARDINGKKPLYYSVTPKGFFFSSELIAIKKYCLTNFDIDGNEVKNFLKFSYGQSRVNTCIKQIKRVDPGSYILVNANSITTKRYWKKNNNVTFTGSYEDAKKKCLALLRESVNLRLRSDVPVGILLSGGVDSSVIASLAAETGNNIHAITVGYKGKYNCDERLIAKKFAAEKGLIWHEIELDENDYEKYFYEYLDYLDEPCSDLASIAKWGIYKKAKELGFKVLLTGDGSDELFYGYKPHNENGNLIDYISFLSKSSNRKEKISNLKRLLDIKFLMRFLFSDFQHLYRTFYYSGYTELENEFKNFKNEFEMENYASLYYDGEKDGIEKIYSYLFNIWLPNNCYYLSDKLAMGNSIENRCPFADQNLIEFVSSLPLEYKFRDGLPKQFLKDVVKDIVPDYILNPVKRGFTPPNNIFEKLMSNYENKYFNSKLTKYNQIVVDCFMGIYNRID